MISATTTSSIQPPRSEDSSWSSGRRIPVLDGLRGIAILLVLLSHYVSFQVHFKPTGLLALVMPILSLGWTGVDLFFVLSGFLIGGILMNHRQSPKYFRTFYLRRFWRIVPIYGLVCVSFWATGFLLDEMHILRPRWLFRLSLPWYSYATLTQNVWLAVAGGWFGANWLSVTWSLAIEEQFYLLAPLVIRLTRPLRVPFLIGAVVLLGVVMRELADTILLFIFPSGSLTEYVMMPCHMDGLAVGVLIAWAVRDESTLAWLKANRRILLALVVVGFMGVCTVPTMHWDMFSRPMWLVGYTWLAWFYGSVLLYSILFADSLLAKALRFRMLRSLGLISYCVYLIHQPISGLCHWLLRNDEPGIKTLPDAGVTLLALFLTLSLATLSWHFYEKPLVEYGHRHTY